MTETAADVSPTATAHEETDVNVRALNTFMIWLVISLAVTAVLVFWQYRRFEALAKANDPPPSPRADERKSPEGPRLLVDELTYGRNFQAEQTSALEETSWVSKDEKLVRIPITRAMELIVKDGLPKWPAPSTSAPATNP